MHKDYLLEIINIVTVKLSKEIREFKVILGLIQQARVRFFNKVIHKVLSSEMYCAQVGLEYSLKLEEVSNRYITE